MWSKTKEDIKVAANIKLGYEQAKVLQDFQTFALIVSKAFGGGKPKDETPKNAAEAKRQFAALFGK